MKQKTYYLGILTALLLLGSCGEDEPKCLNCTGDWPRSNFIQNARGIVNFHPLLTDMKRVSMYNEAGELIHDTVELPGCNDSIYSIGTEFLLSGYFVNQPEPAPLIFQATFCYTKLEVINSNEPK